MAERTMKHIERSKDGVPQWDGDATTFQEYSEMASHWQESIPYHKRYLCGPRLQAELSGTARRFVQAKQPGLISNDHGVETLLQHLRQHLGQPQLSEMAEYLAKYFKQSKRRRHESMNDYITRKAELYSRACQTLGRLQKRYEPRGSVGWLLLQDSGLETAERNNILSALKGNFSLSRVAQELRNQWQDEDIKKRDGGGRGAAWSADCEDEAFMGDLDSQYVGPDWAYLSMAGLSEEGFAILEEADSSAHEALAAIERGRRTLREAREKQHQVKMNRQFYNSSRPWPHRPQSARRLQGQGLLHVFVVAAHIEPMSACVTEDQERALLVSTQEAMQQGKAVIDWGATRTLASVTALEKIMEINANTKGETGLHRLDPELRPTFGFGNSSSDQCLSTAWMKISAGGRNGQLKIHALDKGSGPVLFSVETLRALGAVIDFAEDLVVFRQLDPNQVIKMERSCTGHQLLPMTEDWFQNASQASSGS
eukprot:s548_g33.t1